MDTAKLFSLEGRVAVVTGGSRNLGRQMVEGYLAAGCSRVYITARKAAEEALRKQEALARIGQMAAVVAHEVKNPLAGILGYETRPLVSVDYLNDTRSSIVDAPSTMVVDGTQLKVLAWYDNEMGYVHRMTELGQLVASSLH